MFESAASLLPATTGQQGLRNKQVVTTQDTSVRPRGDVDLSRRPAARAEPAALQPSDCCVLDKSTSVAKDGALETHAYRPLHVGHGDVAPTPLARVPDAILAAACALSHDAMGDPVPEPGEHPPPPADEGERRRHRDDDRPRHRDYDRRRDDDGIAAGSFTPSSLSTTHGLVARAVNPRRRSAYDHGTRLVDQRRQQATRTRRAEEKLQDHRLLCAARRAEHDAERGDRRLVDRDRDHRPRPRSRPRSRPGSRRAAAASCTSDRRARQQWQNDAQRSRVVRAVGAALLQRADLVERLVVHGRGAQEAVSHPPQRSRYVLAVELRDRRRRETRAGGGRRCSAR